MYDRRLIRYHMRRYGVTVADIRRYRRLPANRLLASASARRDGVSAARLKAIQYVITSCKIQARYAVFLVHRPAWEANMRILRSTIKNADH